MNRGGTFIDDGDAGEWAKALRFAPWIDLDHDGTLFANIAFLTPDRAFECPFQLSEDGGQPLPAFAPDVLGSLHDTPNSPEAQDDHA